MKQNEILFVNTINVTDTDDTETETYLDLLVERLQSLADQTTRARLVVGVDHEGVETHRFFVTPDDWPDLAGSDR